MQQFGAWTTVCISCRVMAEIPAAETALLLELFRPFPYWHINEDAVVILARLQFDMAAIARIGSAAAS
jgi:hypothetical protein